MNSNAVICYKVLFIFNLKVAFFFLTESGSYLSWAWELSRPWGKRVGILKLTFLLFKKCCVVDGCRGRGRLQWSVPTAPLRWAVVASEGVSIRGASLKVIVSRQFTRRHCLVKLCTGGLNCWKIAYQPAYSDCWMLPGPWLNHDWIKLKIFCIILLISIYMSTQT